MKPDLAAFLAPNLGRKLAWGEFDCCIVMADWVQLCTGFDPMAGVRGTYKGWKQAAKTWKALGGVETAVSAALDRKFARVPVHRAERGDVCLVQTHHRACTCAVVDTCGVWLPTKTGYRLVRGWAPVKTFWRIE
jgi:hypothetical protein